MRIVDYRIGTIEIPLNKPFVTALRRVETVSSLLLEIRTDNGLVGRGSSAETRVITGDTQAGIIQAIRVILEALEGEDLFGYNRVFDRIGQALIGNTSGKAAVDMAVHDVLAQAAGMPLYRYLGGSSGGIRTDMTISIGDPEQMVSDAMEAYSKGFRSLKIKLGEDPNKDYVRMANLFKHLGNKVTYRIDANQGWRPKEAVWLIGELEQLGIGMELVEQPVHYRDFDGLKFVTDRVNIPILADESVFSFEEAQRLIHHRAADMLNIKLMKTGGIHAATMIARLAQTYRIPCMIGSMMESPISLHAAIHFGLSQKSVQFYDLDVPSMYDPSDFVSAFTYGPEIMVSDDGGLGFTALREERIQWK